MDVGEAETPSVVVAVLTYRRPALLVPLLPEIARQAARVRPRAEVLVVDNDPDAGARSTVVGLGLAGVTYVHEPVPGIAAGRNAALRHAGDADVLVFIDDDETPAEDWLGTLLTAHRVLGGAAVAGPVVRLHERPPAAWVRAARVFDRRRMATGTPMQAAGSGNLLVDMRHVRRHQLSFDDRLGLAGGSDHLFTRQIRRTGGSIHWCDEAVVTESVPADRLTPRWTLRRGYRSGATEVRIELMLSSGPRERLGIRSRALARGAARVLGGLARVALGLVTRSPEHQGRGAWTAARGAGMVGVVVGRIPVEYARAAG